MILYLHTNSRQKDTQFFLISVSLRYLFLYRHNLPIYTIHFQEIPPLVRSNWELIFQKLFIDLTDHSKTCFPGFFTLQPTTTKHVFLLTSPTSTNLLLILTGLAFSLHILTMLRFLMPLSNLFLLHSNLQ